MVTGGRLLSVIVTMSYIATGIGRGIIRIVLFGIHESFY